MTSTQSSSGGGGTASPADVPALPEDVLTRLPGRDPEALAAFFDAFFGRVYGYVRRLVGDDHLAEDLTQDIFLHIQRSIESYDPDRDIRPWVFTIATNKVRDYWRSRRHRDSLTEESVEQDGSADGISAGRAPDADLTEEEMGDQVRQAIDELPEGMRMTLMLRVYEGLSFEEIGDMFERNEVAVRKRYSRALELLRQTLGPAYRIHVEGT